MDKPWYRKLLPRRRLNEAEAEQTRTRARAGDRDAQFAVGMTYGCGTGSLHDPAQARQWLERAAEQDHVLAQFNLARVYAAGQGVAPDPTAAEYWMRRAADHGDPGAQFDLGLRCLRASHTRAEPAATEARIEAYKWLRLAADQGYGTSASACETLNLSLTREELTEAQHRVEVFAAAHPA